ncbi:hypothetical protein L596_007087 [Steinernema carpocapsae]|uniref:Uncharacterized protein n=1 Tax=Steinernema carpocapsae TaxID=34508 RepID=A0A4U5P980_STECR|nr:hypothetical protein L596_007087 [Steinernema carpocapsae]
MSLPSILLGINDLSLDEAPLEVAQEYLTDLLELARGKRAALAASSNGDRMRKSLLILRLTALVRKNARKVFGKAAEGQCED